MKVPKMPRWLNKFEEYWYMELTCGWKTHWIFYIDYEREKFIQEYEHAGRD